jgi:hypothetical protein
MDSSELRFEYNFLASKLNVDNLSELYSVADKLLGADSVIDELSGEGDNLFDGFFEQWIHASETVERRQNLVNQYQEQLKEMKNLLAEAKKGLKAIEEGVPTKVKSAAKVVKQNKEKFNKLSSEVLSNLPTDELEKLPMLKRVILKNK